MASDVIFGIVTIALTLLGAAVSLSPPIKLRWKISYAAGFVILGIVAVVFLIRMSKETSATGQQLKDALSGLSASTTKIADMTALNKDLEEKLAASNSAIKSLAEESIQVATGGNSFCYIDFTHFVDSPRLINEGKYPVHALTVTVKNFEEMKKLFDRIPQAQFHPEWDFDKDYKTFAEVTIPIGDLAPYGNIPLPRVPILQLDHEKTLDVVFTANNGYVFQRTCLRNATNSLPPRYLLAAATKVTDRKKVRKTAIDENYPKNEVNACFPQGQK